MNAMICGYHIRTDNPDFHHFRMHTHDFYEIYCFLDGHVDYCVEGNRHRLQRGDIMLIRKGEAHNIQLRSANRYERMYVHFDVAALQELAPLTELLAPFHDRLLGKYNHFPAALCAARHLPEFVDKICNCENESRRLCYLLPLLSELSDVFETVKNTPTLAEIDPAASLIQYINSNLSEDLCLDRLSQRFYLSKTHLNRLFKQSTGTTIWKYITVKRLFYAKELLEGGMTPTEAYLKCGFSDYTTFYRCYRHQFGVPPCSAKKQNRLPR